MQYWLIGRHRRRSNGCRRTVSRKRKMDGKHHHNTRPTKRLMPLSLPMPELSVSLHPKLAVAIGTGLGKGFENHVGRTIRHLFRGQSGQRARRRIVSRQTVAGSQFQASRDIRQTRCQCLEFIPIRPYVRLRFRRMVQASFRKQVGQRIARMGSDNASRLGYRIGVIGSRTRASSRRASSSHR